MSLLEAIDLNRDRASVKRRYRAVVSYRFDCAAGQIFGNAGNAVDVLALQDAAAKEPKTRAPRRSESDVYRYELAGEVSSRGVY